MLHTLYPVHVPTLLWFVLDVEQQLILVSGWTNIQLSCYKEGSSDLRWLQCCSAVET